MKGLKIIHIYSIIGLQALGAIYFISVYTNYNVFIRALAAPRFFNILVTAPVVLLILGLSIRNRILIYAEVVYLTLLVLFFTLLFQLI